MCACNIRTCLNQSILYSENCRGPQVLQTLLQIFITFIDRLLVQDVHSSSFFAKQQKKNKSMVNHVWACLHMQYDGIQQIPWSIKKISTQSIMVSSTIPEMFVNSNTLHFSQTNVLQSHVCVKLLQMLTFKKYIKINAKPCKYVHLKFDYLTLINFQIK